jgi:hypothetical protein
VWSQHKTTLGPLTSGRAFDTPSVAVPCHSLRPLTRVLYRTPVRTQRGRLASQGLRPLTRVLYRTPVRTQPLGTGVPTGLNGVFRHKV